MTCCDYAAQSEKKEREVFLLSRLTHFVSSLQRTPNPGPAPRTAVHLEGRPDHRRPLLYPSQAVAVGVHGSGIQRFPGLTARTGRTVSHPAALVACYVAS